MNSCLPDRLLIIAGLLLSLSVGTAAAGEVPWFDRVTTPPEELPEPIRPIPELMVTKQGEPIEDLSEWKKKRQEIRADWMEFLGPLPKRPQEDAFQVLDTKMMESVLRKRIRYEAEVGRFVEAFLLQPREDSKQKRAGIVLLHATNAETINTVGGKGDIGPRLARRGFVVICPANYLWEQSSYLKAVAAAKERNPKSLGMATMIGDGMRAVDILQGMPSVDDERIGAIGHSLGAKEVLYLMAFDQRVRVGVASEGGIGLDSTNWHDPWYLGPEINEPGFERSHAELIALIAPRPFLVFAGESGPGASDGVRSWPYLLAARPIYKLYGKPFRAGIWNHRQGHDFSIEMQRHAFKWLEAFLR